MNSHQKLSCAEGDDPSNGIVGRDADRHAITGHDLDAEASHASAQLREHLVARIDLYAIQPAGVHRHHGALHVDQIVFAQQLILSRKCSNECAIGTMQAQSSRDPFLSQ